MGTKVVGSIVLTTDQGLGYLAKAFFDHGLIQKVYIHPHSSRTNHVDWYPKDAVVTYPEDLLDCDSLLFFEEVWHWKLIPMARERGVRTALMPMYECTRNPLPYQPDTIIAPSRLDQNAYPGSTFIPVPVEVPWKLRERAKIFVHNAGNGGLGGRNGTREVLAAWQYVKSSAKLILRSQVPVQAVADPRIDVRVGQFEDIWSEGDVFIFPEKFNGLSLPLQEAYAAGMLVMAGRRFPMDTWLPKEPLIPVARYTTERIAREFQSAHYDPKVIAQMVDEWYDKPIESYSRQGHAWATKHSWDNLREQYETAL